MSTENNTWTRTNTSLPDSHTAHFKETVKHKNMLEGYTTQYIDIAKGYFCCKKMMVLAKFHDNMDLNKDGRISVYAPDDSFWKRQINLEYFEFEYCPYCAKRLYTT